MKIDAEIYSLSGKTMTQMNGGDQLSTYLFCQLTEEDVHMICDIVVDTPIRINTKEENLDLTIPAEYFEAIRNVEGIVTTTPGI